MKIEIEARRECSADQRGGDVVVRTDRRWLRFVVYVGTPPGSRIGFWRTWAYGLRGWNVRVGKRYVGPCLTAFVHTRRIVSREKL